MPVKLAVTKLSAASIAVFGSLAGIPIIAQSTVQTVDGLLEKFGVLGGLLAVIWWGSKAMVAIFQQFVDTNKRYEDLLAKTTATITSNGSSMDRVASEISELVNTMVCELGLERRALKLAEETARKQHNTGGEREDIGDGGSGDPGRGRLRDDGAGS